MSDLIPYPRSLSPALKEDLAILCDRLDQAQDQAAQILHETKLPADRGKLAKLPDALDHLAALTKHAATLAALCGIVAANELAAQDREENQ